MKPASRHPAWATVLISFAVLWSTVWAEFVIQPTGLLQLLSLLLSVALLPVLLLTLAWTLDGWDGWKVRCLIPSAIAGFIGVAGIVAGDLGPTVQFQRYLPEMQRTVEALAANPAFQTNNVYKVAELGQKHPWANGVFLVEQPEGPKNVEFFFGSGFPVKHSAYLWCAAGSIERGSETARRWPRRRQVAPNWFIVHD